MKLTLPAVEPGFRYILADGMKVGHVVDIWDDGPGHQAWEAHLGRGGKTLVRKRLADLRTDLKVLAEKEPWWPTRGQVVGEGGCSGSLSSRP